MGRVAFQQACGGDAQNRRTHQGAGTRFQFLEHQGVRGDAGQRGLGYLETRFLKPIEPRRHSSRLP